MLLLPLTLVLESDLDSRKDLIEDVLLFSDPNVGQKS